MRSGFTPSALAAAIAVAIALGLAAPAPARAQGRVIGPGGERAVVDLLRPHAAGREVVDGVVVAGIAIQPESVTVTLRNPAGETGRVTFSVLSAAAAARRGRDFGAGEIAAAGPDLVRAAERVAASVAANDDGTFAFFGVAADDPVRGAQGEVVPLHLATVAVAAALWLLLLWALLAPLGREVVRLVRERALPARPALLVAAGVALVFAVGFALRAAAPFTPIHANHHAFRDILPAIDPDYSLVRSGPFMTEYGPSFFLAQRWLAALFGRHHDGVALQSAVVGALALAVAAGAAARRGGALAATLAGLAVTVLPLTARIGSSESALVFAQFLVATTLLFGVRRAGRTDAAGFHASLGLLTLGHPIGIGLAGATALVAWALAPDDEPLGRRLRWLGLGAVVCVAAFLPYASTHVAAMGGRDQALTPALVLEGAVYYRVAWSGDWSSPALVPWTLLGVAAFLARERRRRDRALRAAALLGGGAALLFVCGLVRANVTDTLRYMALGAPAVVVVCGLAGALLRVPGARLRTRAAVLGALAGLALWVGSDVVRGVPVGRFADSQEQAYRALRRILEAEDLSPTLVWPDMRAHTRAAPNVGIFPPLGRVSADGAVLRVVPADVFRRRCAAGGSPGGEGGEGPWYVWLPPPFWEAHHHGPTDPVAELRPFIAPGGRRWEGTVRPARIAWVRSEFMGELEQGGRWLLAEAACPRR